MECPHCGLINIENSKKCDCGYDFINKIEPKQINTFFNKKFLIFQRRLLIYSILLSFFYSFGVTSQISSNLIYIYNISVPLLHIASITGTLIGVIIARYFMKNTAGINKLSNNFKNMNWFIFVVNIILAIVVFRVINLVYIRMEKLPFEILCEYTYKNNDINMIIVYIIIFSQSIIPFIIIGFCLTSLMFNDNLYLGSKHIKVLLMVSSVISFILGCIMFYKK